MTVKTLSCLLITISSFSSIFGQNWVFIQKQDVQQEITACDIGTLGKLYVGTERGNVYSFQMDGTPDAQFSSSVFLPVTDIDASNSLRIFVFYKDAGRFEYLDRFTAQPRTYHLEDFGINKAEHAALDEDGSIWLLSGLNLNHINALNNSLLSTDILPSTLDFDSITDIAYNRRLIFSESALGIVSWDGSGISFEPRPTVGIQSFDIFENELVALSDRGVLIHNQKTSEKMWLQPPAKELKKVIKTRQVFHFIQGSQIFSYRLEK